MMKAAIITKFGGPEVFEIQNRETPRVNSREVLISVKAAGINRPDVFQRKGHYPAPKGAVQDIPGLEVSGTVVEKGSQVHRFQVGDEVMALLPGGGYANYARADEGSCILKPNNLSFEQAASLPETMFTVWHNLFRLGRLKAKEIVLIQGGSGGIGSMAIQLSNLFDAEVITTVGSEQKKQYVKDLGASKAINYKTEDFVELVKDKGVDVILDSIG
ncbi:MAG: alcohol dehydrogenase catalytic domain-containing protein, partial [Sphingobacterium sp.]